MLPGCTRAWTWVALRADAGALFNSRVLLWLWCGAHSQPDKGEQLDVLHSPAVTGSTTPLWTENIVVHHDDIAGRAG